MASSTALLFLKSGQRAGAAINLPDKAACAVKLSPKRCHSLAFGRSFI
jgi:hypothetical protein